MRSFSGISPQTMGRAKIFELLRQGGLRAASGCLDEDPNNVEPLRYRAPLKAHTRPKPVAHPIVSSDADTFEFKPMASSGLTELYPELRASAGNW